MTGTVIITWMAAQCVHYFINYTIVSFGVGNAVDRRERYRRMLNDRLYTDG
jgi:lipoprotein signal peptidase